MVQWLRPLQPAKIVIDMQNQTPQLNVCDIAWAAADAGSPMFPATLACQNWDKHAKPNTPAHRLPHSLVSWRLSGSLGGFEVFSLPILRRTCNTIYPSSKSQHSQGFGRPREPNVFGHFSLPDFQNWDKLANPNAPASSTSTA